MRSLQIAHWLSLGLLFSAVTAFYSPAVPASSAATAARSAATTAGTARSRLYLLEKQKEQKDQTLDEKALSVDEITQKYGLEVGLTKALFQKTSDDATADVAATSGTESAKSLLKKYGIAYLATSIPLACSVFPFVISW